MKKFLLVAILALGMTCAAGTAAAQGDEYRECLESLLQKSGALAASDVVMDQMIPSLQQMSAGDVPAEFWTGFRQRWNRKMKDRMVDIYVPIYQKYFTLDELREIVAFYDSPVGRKLAAATPAMTREGMEKGQQLGMEIANEMMAEVRSL